MSEPQPRATLRSPDLERWIHQSLTLGDVDVFALGNSATKPFRFGLRDARTSTLMIARIFAWNTTHGGGSLRATDEFRIQLTGAMPDQSPGEVTLILGWSSHHRVFAAWDPGTHTDRVTASPSLQVREEVMREAARVGIAAGIRASGDVVVAFRPELLATYAQNVQAIHADPELTARWANGLGSRPNEVAESGGTVEEEEIQAERPRVQRQVEVAVRAWDFRDRVMAAYSNRCSICNIGLRLAEGAHIVPVAYPGSTDETRNGLALCKNHHLAYDRSLVSVAPDYTVEVSRRRMEDFSPLLSPHDTDWVASLDGKPLARIPQNPDERPDPEYLEVGRQARRWVG